MKKLTKTMMVAAAAITMYEVGCMMYNKNNKKIVKKYETYLNN